MTKYYARSQKKDIPKQEYSAHIHGVRSLARGYMQEMARYAIRDSELLEGSLEKAATYHDLGKLSKHNQAILSGGEVSNRLEKHWDAGVAHFLKDDNLCNVSALAIYSHHIGLPDFDRELIKGEAAFREVSVLSDVDRSLPEFEAIHSDCVEPCCENDGDNEISGNPSVFFRILLSCLVDADHTDAAKHNRQYPADAKDIPLRASERLLQLDSHVRKWKQSEPASERNNLRNEMYYACRDKNVESNISSCDSPVGSGKTTAVMAHMLAQAHKRGLRRLFIVLPFTNIITQSVKIYRDLLVLPGEKAEEVVAELHHRADFENEDIRHLTALWRAPIIVTTAVAFFETLASRSTGTVRRLHELPGSAIFMDESHAALPAKLMPLAWKWINIFASEWSCYWVLASGSLTRFWTIPEIALTYNSEPISEIIDEPLRNRLAAFEKRRISYHSDLSPKNTAELAEWVATFPGPRLVILNTVQSAAVVAHYIAEHYGQQRVEHLSTALTPTDRDKTLAKVMERLKDEFDFDWTLVATSCVEAGINFSFRNGFRELAALVSVVQASGRVDRECSFNDSEMWIFRIKEDGMLKNNPGLKEAAAVLKRYIEKGVPIKPGLSTQSIADEISLQGVTGPYKKLIENEGSLRFEQVEKDFRVIETDTRLVVVDSIEADRLQYGKVDWRELQKASVQIAKYKLDELRTPVLTEKIYKWNLDYDEFLGYMAGIIKINKLVGEALIV